MEITKLIEGAKKSKKAFESLKNAAVLCGQYEFAVELREIEKEAFPESEEVQAIKSESKILSGIFGMVGLKIDPETSWIISEALKGYNEKSTQFALSDASEIMEKVKQIF